MKEKSEYNIGKRKSQKTRFLITAAFTVVMAIVCVAAFRYYSVYRNYRTFSKNMRELSDITEEKNIYLSELTPFSWDSVYAFDPYVSKEEMESILGFSSPFLTEGVSETMTTVFFVKEEKVVCRIVGYPSNLGYYLDLNHWWNTNKSYMRISNGMDQFTLIPDMNLVHLKFQGQIFTGTIREVKGDMALIDVDADQDIRNSGDKVMIQLNEEQQKLAKPGDRVRVAYDGFVQEISPLHLGGQMETELLLKESNTTAVLEEE